MSMRTARPAIEWQTNRPAQRGGKAEGRRALWRESQGPAQTARPAIEGQKQ